MLRVEPERAARPKNHIPPTLRGVSERPALAPRGERTQELRTEGAPHRKGSVKPRLEEDRGGDLVRATVIDELDGPVQVRFAAGELLGQRKRISRLDQHVEPPALDLRALSLRVDLNGLGHLGHIGHRASCSCFGRRTLPTEVGMKPSIRSRRPQLGAGSAKDALEPLVDERSHLVEPLGELLRPRVEHAPAGLHVRGESVEPAADVRLNLREAAFERHHQLGSSAIEEVGSLREALLESLLARVADVTEPLREDGLRVAREHRSRALELSREPLSRVLPRRLDRFRELLLGRLRVAGGGALDDALELLDLTPPDVLEARCNPADRFVLFALDLLAELALATAKAFSDLVERSATLSGMLVELGGRGRECLLGGLPELLAEPDDSRALLLGRGLDALGVLLDAGPHVGEQALLPFAKPSDLRFERMLCLLHVGRPFCETLLHLARSE